MAIELELYTELVEILKDSCDCPRLNEWESKFLADMGERFTTYEMEVRLSEKQIETFRRIARTKIYV